MEIDTVTWNWKCFWLTWDLKWVLGSFDVVKLQNSSFCIMKTRWASPISCWAS